jgi:hypothetical protein
MREELKGYLSLADKMEYSFPSDSTPDMITFWGNLPDCNNTRVAKEEFNEKDVIRFINFHRRLVSPDLRVWWWR